MSTGSISRSLRGGSAAGCALAGVAALLLLAAPSGAETPPEKPLAAEARPAEAQAAKAGAEARPAGETRLSVYVPPSRGAAGARTGGGTRGLAATPALATLAPDHVGLTRRADPVLGWYQSTASPARLELSLIADGAVEPLLETRLTGPKAAGFHWLHLAEHGVVLEEGVTYDWFVALVLDPEARDRDVVAGAALRRVAAADETTAPGEPPHRRLARDGVWYDALEELTAAIARDPADASLRAERAGWLDQVGLGSAAGYDRREGDAPSAAR